MSRKCDTDKCTMPVTVEGNRLCKRCAGRMRHLIAQKFPFPVSIQRRRDPEYMPERHDDSNPWRENAVRDLEDCA